eukprot:48922-Chlamydomonas_euryale.AAC.3
MKFIQPAGRLRSAHLSAGKVISTTRQQHSKEKVWVAGKGFGPQRLMLAAMGSGCAVGGALLHPCCNEASLHPRPHAAGSHQDEHSRPANRQSAVNTIFLPSCVRPQASVLRLCQAHPQPGQTLPACTDNLCGNARHSGQHA